MNLIKTCFVPHENANLIFPIHDGRPVLDMVWVWRPSPWWKKIHRGVYLKKLKEFRIQRKKMMVHLAEEHDAEDFIFGVKNNEAPSMWEMVHDWRKYGPRHFDSSL